MRRLRPARRRLRRRLGGRALPRAASLVHPRDLVSGIWENLTYVVSNEADWPDLGFATGFRATQMPQLSSGGPADSIYLR